LLPTKTARIVAPLSRQLLMATMSSGDGWVGNEVFSVAEALEGCEGSAPLAALGWAPGGVAIAGGADWTADSTASSESEEPLPSSARLTRERELTRE
jgi:hypothetical protein